MRGNMDSHIYLMRSYDNELTYIDCVAPSHVDVGVSLWPSWCVSCRFPDSLFRKLFRGGLSLLLAL
jgi:hypothetical protein